MTLLWLNYSYSTVLLISSNEFCIVTRNDQKWNYKIFSKSLISDSRHISHGKGRPAKTPRMANPMANIEYKQRRWYTQYSSRHRYKHSVDAVFFFLPTHECSLPAILTFCVFFNSDKSFGKWCLNFVMHKHAQIRIGYHHCTVCEYKALTHIYFTILPIALYEL